MLRKNIKGKIVFFGETNIMINKKSFQSHSFRNFKIIAIFLNGTIWNNIYFYIFFKLFCTQKYCSRVIKK